MRTSASIAGITAIFCLCTSLRAQDLPPTTQAATRAATLSTQPSTQQAATRPLPAPVSITLHYTNAPQMDVLEDFAKQAGADMGIHRQSVVLYERDKTATINLDHVSFWAALEAVESSTGLISVMSPGSTQLLLDPGHQNFPDPALSSNSSQVQGPFLIVPQSCQMTATVPYSKTNPRAMNFSVHLLVLAEPRVRILGGRTNQKWLTECLDDRNNSLLPEQPIGSGSEGGWWWQIYSNLKMPTHMGGKITRLRGELDFTMVTRSEKFLLSDLTKLEGVTRTVGDSTFKFRKFVDQDDTCQVMLTVTSSRTLLTQAQVLLDLLNSIQVLDENGLPLRSVRPSMRSFPDFWNFTLTYSKGHEPVTGGEADVRQNPAQLRWDVPLDMAPVRVQFELHDLELPHAP